MLLAARNVEPLISQLHSTPLAEGSDLSAEIPVARQVDRRGELAARTQTTNGVSPIPTDDYSVAPVRSLDRLPSLLSSSFTSLAVSDQLFVAKLASGQLLGREWIGDDALSAEESATVDLGNVKGRAGKNSVRTQRAVVLVDISHSMNNWDQRGAVARGLAVAFLRRAARPGARMHVAPFQTSMGTVTTADQSVQLPNVLYTLLGYVNASFTNIQRSLDDASRTILEGAHFQDDDLLLISDGLSKLKEKPSALGRLHTFLVGNILERTEEGMQREIDLEGQLRTLKRWSTSFQTLDGELLASELN
jgi:uncharacterized protein with von Willebrand factor type A (vWA) domain